VARFVARSKGLVARFVARSKGLAARFVARSKGLARTRLARINGLRASKDTRPPLQGYKASLARIQGLPCKDKRPRAQALIDTAKHASSQS
jgi:hypothetical protein